MRLTPSVQLLLSAIVLGIAGDILLRVNPTGISATLWIVAIIGAAALVLRRSGADPSIAVPPALLFAACVTLRDSGPLLACTVVAVLLTLLLPVIQRDGIRLASASVPRYALAYGRAVRGTLFGVVPLVAKEIRWEALFNRAWQRKVGAAALGLGLALPVVTVFGALFASADPVFARAVERIFDWDVGWIIEHGFFTIVCTVLAAGYLRGVRGRSLPLSGPRPGPGLGILALSIPMGALVTLFAAFAGLQLRYLFGGVEVIRETTGLTYAEWARRGFFELVAASALVVPVLLAAIGRLRATTSRDLRLVRWLAGSLIGLVAMVMASALYRMALYVDAYGLSQDRLYASVFMGWVGILLAWLAATSLRGRGERFAVGALITGLGILATLNLSNPAALVVRTNVARAERGHEFDARYHAHTLGDDAVPTLLASLPRLTPEVQCEVVGYLYSRHSLARSSDWRSWNVARWRAGRAWRRHAKELEGKPCSASMQLRLPRDEIPHDPRPGYRGPAPSPPA